MKSIPKRIHNIPILVFFIPSRVHTDATKLCNLISSFVRLKGVLFSSVYSRNLPKKSRWWWWVNPNDTYFVTIIISEQHLVHKIWHFLTGKHYLYGTVHPHYFRFCSSFPTTRPNCLHTIFPAQKHKSILETICDTALHPKKKSCMWNKTRPTIESHSSHYCRVPLVTLLSVSKRSLYCPPSGIPPNHYVLIPGKTSVDKWWHSLKTFFYSISCDASSICFQTFCSL